MSQKRNLNGKNVSSPAKRVKYNVAQEQSGSNQSNVFDDMWGEDFGEEEIEEMDFIASQATQEEKVFVRPEPKTNSNMTSFSLKNSPTYATPSTSSGKTSFQNHVAPVAQSQMLASSEIDREILESTQAIMFDAFENDIKSDTHNSTFRNRADGFINNVVMVSDDEHVEQWKEEKKKLLEDFMTKEGETEFLRQQLNQIQTRAENNRKEQARLLELKEQKHREEINLLKKEKTALETQLHLKTLEFNSFSEKAKLKESGVKFTQPQVNMMKNNKDRSNTSGSWTPKKVKTKENGVQAEQLPTPDILKTSRILYPLIIIPDCTFEPPELEKSVIDIKIEEKIGKRNLAIIQDEETFRIFENPELSKPKITVMDGQNLSTEFFLPDLVKLMNMRQDEINSLSAIPILNKLVATSRELLLNSTLVLQKISQALQNDDIRDMNELYLSEFYEMPVPHTKSFCQAQSWYDLERGIETRRAIGVLSYIVVESKYLANHIAGNMKLRTDKDSDYKRYVKQMKSYNEWSRKGFDYEFLDLILEFFTVVGKIRRSHQFTGLINALMTLIVNVQANVGFSSLGIRRICSIVKEVIYSRPLLACFSTLTRVLMEFSKTPSLVSKLCITPDKSGISYWKGSLNFIPDACALEIFITQLDCFKLDPITLINITKNLTAFSHKSFLHYSIPWLHKTTSCCNCCINLLKIVIVNLNECCKINVEELKSKYSKSNISWRASKLQTDSKVNKINWKDEICEDWKMFEKKHKQNKQFWEDLKMCQLLAIAYGIRLLSLLAKRDCDFMIRMIEITDGFHLFLYNLSKRTDLKVEGSDEIALAFVKQTFVLEKSKEESDVNELKLDAIHLDSERWADFTSTSPDLTKLYNESLYT